eukprot:3311355-Pyramimonas_sp.AAC.1
MKVMVEQGAKGPFWEIYGLCSRTRRMYTDLLSDDQSFGLVMWGSPRWGSNSGGEAWKTWKDSG